MFVRPDSVVACLPLVHLLSEAHHLLSYQPLDPGNYSISKPIGLSTVGRRSICETPQCFTPPNVRGSITLPHTCSPWKSLFTANRGGGLSQDVAPGNRLSRVHLPYDVVLRLDVGLHQPPEPTLRSRFIILSENGKGPPRRPRSAFRPSPCTYQVDSETAGGSTLRKVNL